ncbi:MAG: hypothetical protein ACREVB_08830 [Burkholderiales bacterium]
MIRVLLLSVAIAFAAPAFGQSGERGSIPPGSSQDGSRPSDGAIKGGAILPGESAGVPQKAPSPSRCDELQETLREDCLKQERDAASGATKAPSEPRTRPPERAD